MNFVHRTLGYAVIGFVSAMISAAALGQSAGESPFSDRPPVQAEAIEKTVLNGSVKTVSKETVAALASSDEFCQCIGGSLTSETVRKIERALKAPLHPPGLDFTDQPLSDVMALIQEDYGIPIQIDRTALDSAGIRVDQQLNLNIHNVTLGAALRLMLKTVGLTYVIQDEVLIITTPEEADRRLRICVYNVGGIVGKSEPQLDALIDILQSCVATETWAKNGGGEAEIRPIKPSVLVISQTARVHEEIRELMTTIQNVRGSTAPAAIQQAAHDHAATEEIVTRSYSLLLNPTNDVDTMRSQVRELITGALPDEVWSGRLGDGQPVLLSVFHDRVVVRHTSVVQDKVAKLLSDSGIAMPAAGGPANPPFGGGGFGGGGGRFGEEGGTTAPGGPGGGFFSHGLENDNSSESGRLKPNKAVSPEGVPEPAKVKHAMPSTNPFE